MPERRQTADRRHAASRRERRKGDTRVFVIELTSDELRVAQKQKAVVAGGNDLIVISSLQWRREASRLQSREGLAELGSALREVARIHAMHGCEIRLVLSGEFCIMRALRGTSEDARAELQQLEQRSRLYLALGPGEKVLVSHTQTLDARHSHVLAAICLRSTLETIHAAAESAGVELASIEPALSSLTRAVSRLPDVPAEPYLLVHACRGSTEIGVCHEGQLLLDYRPGGRTRVGDLTTLLQTHKNRLSRHVGRCLRVSPPDLKHVFVCGDPQEVQTAQTEFRTNLAMEVHVVEAGQIQATWEFQGGDASAASPAALGALLGTYLPDSELNSPNLLQHILDSKREPIRARLIRSMLPIAATLLAAAGLALWNARQQTAIDGMQAELDGLAVQEGRANELRLQLTATESKLMELEKLADTLPCRLGETLVTDVAHCMPSDVWLSRLEIHGGQRMRLEGASYLEAGVYDFVRWLEEAPAVAEVALKRTTPSSSASGPTTGFELEVNLNAPAPASTKVARHE